MKVFKYVIGKIVKLIRALFTIAILIIGMSISAAILIAEFIVLVPIATIDVMVKCGDSFDEAIMFTIRSYIEAFVECFNGLLEMWES